jgi:hypothetical protein
MVRVRVLVLAVLLALPMVGLASTPASAAGLGCNTYGDADICVYVNATNDTVFGYILLSNRNDSFNYATVYVRQCRTDFTNCVTIAANSNPLYPYYIQTSSKPAPLGHVFAAFGTWQTAFGYHYVNVRSDWRSNP